MKKRIIFVVISTVLVICALHSGIVSAQDIDIESMDNAQLLQLLQVIMQKLESDGSEETEEPLPAETPAAEVGVAMIPGGKLFSIYENKKLMIEAIPGYMFIQKPGEETPEPKDKNKDSGKEDDSHGWVTDEHGCEPGQQWVCDIYGACYCTWAKG